MVGEVMEGAGAGGKEGGVWREGSCGQESW